MSANTIPLADFRRLFDAGQPLIFLDVRTPAEYSVVHAQGARLVPFDVLDPAAIASARSDPAAPIYVICESGGRAGKACELFEAAGVVPVYSVEGGTAAWAKAGLPVVRGKSKVISLERQVRIGAGALVVVGVILACAVHRVFLVIPAFVGAGLIFAGVTNYCGMGMALAKMPWNRRSE